jgi:hypothetical protein
MMVKERTICCSILVIQGVLKWRIIFMLHESTLNSKEKIVK